MVWNKVTNIKLPHQSEVNSMFGETNVTHCILINYYFNLHIF